MGPIVAIAAAPTTVETVLQAIALPATAETTSTETPATTSCHPAQSFKRNVSNGFYHHDTMIKHSDTSRAQLTVRKRVINRCTHRDRLCGIALLGRGARAIGVDFGGGLVFCIGNAGAQTQLLERLFDHSARDHG